MCLVRQGLAINVKWLEVCLMSQPVIRTYTCPYYAGMSVIWSWYAWGEGEGRGCVGAVYRGVRGNADHAFSSVHNDHTIATDFSKLSTATNQIACAVKVTIVHSFDIMCELGFY